MEDSHSDDDSYRNDLNRGQYLSFIITVGTSSTMSMIGSYYVLRLASRNLTLVYHRIISCISVLDIILSASNIVHLMLVPADRTSNPFAFGNEVTCSMMGFILNVVLVMISFYSAFLAINFLLQVRYRWSNQDVATYIEPFFHIVTVGMSLPLPCLALHWHMMNPEILSGLCLMIEYPNGCDYDEDVECISGGDIGGMLGITTAAFVYTVGAVGFVCTYMLYRTVKETMRKIQVYTTLSQQLDQNQQKRIRRVSWQCTMYMSAYTNTIVWPAVHQIAGMFDVENRLGDPLPYMILLLPLFFFPLQGFLNLIVFITPRYQQWRKALPDASRVTILSNALSAEDPPTRRPQCATVLLSSRSQQPQSERSRQSIIQNTAQRPDGDGSQQC